ncbi:hypothetical protein ACH5RR_041243 [Cinchona calisaya]|uniref:Protein FAR1-RELATED SEQUENCE n=1 Tax=Cinchona calisaya TaxID=153742 RepID=A0ABD2XUX5_9GENT
MDATSKCACGNVCIDLSHRGNGDSDGGDGTRRGVEDNEMNVGLEGNNGSRSGDAESDRKNVNGLESSWLRLNKGFDEMTEEDVLGMIFDSDEEAGMFYETYAKVIGFNVRKVDTKRDKENVVRYRRWVCSREGHREMKWINYDRKRDPRPTSRVGCLASFRIKSDRKSGKYIVTGFIKEHNHDLASPKVIPPFMQPNKRARRAVHNIGFTKKDVERAWARSDIQDGDNTECVLTHCVLASLCAKSDYDPGLFYKYDVDEEGQLRSIFWADSKSIADYSFFGDVLALDSKYRTNAYGKPLIIFSGFNNHHQTTIFGCALLGDDTADTYLWMLETFLAAMNQKAPVSVIVNGEKAIEEAIEQTFPTSHHRICRWRLYKDAVSKAGDTSFGPDFKKCMEENCAPDEFEVAWIKLVEKYGLQGHPWFEETYSRRTKWAEAYVREHFFAGMYSIRGQGASTYFSRFLKVRLKLHEFVRYYDKALVCFRDEEAKEDTASESSFPVLSTFLRDLEGHAADVFTRNMFLKFREQIMSDAMLIVTGKQYLEDEACWTYNISEYMKPDMTWKVHYDPTNQRLTCSCFKLVTEGMPCCHMVSVMKAEHLREIPRCCIYKRWTKCARSDLDSGIDIQALNTTTQVARFGILSSLCSEMNYYASQTMQGFNETRNLICKFTSHVKQIYVSKGEVDEPATEVSHDADGSSTKSGNHDPRSTDTNGQCDAGPVEVTQPGDSGHRRSTSDAQTTFSLLQLNHGCQTAADIGTIDGCEGSRHNGNISEMPSLSRNFLWEDNL